VTLKGNCGCLAPLTAGEAMAFICQTISFSEGEKWKFFSKTDKTTSGSKNYNQFCHPTA
jgi:hypothetical protein